MSLCTLKLMRSSMLRIKDDEIFFPVLGSVPVLGVISMLGVICNRALEVHSKFKKA